MLIAPKPTLNLLAGWQYLFSSDYRQEVNYEWQVQPAWVRAVQITVGICSALFPLIVVGLLGFVLISRYL